MREVVGLFDEVAMPQFPAGTPEAVGAAFGIDAATLRNRTVGLATARRGIDTARTA